MTDEELIAAWHSPFTATEICTKYGIGYDALYNHWRQMRADGCVPDRQRTHARYNKHTGYLRGNSRSWLGRDTCDHLDGRPRGNNEKFLSLLREHHGDAGRPDIYPGAR